MSHEEEEDVGAEDLFEKVTVVHVPFRDQAGETEAGRLRMIEALLFAAAEPLDEKSLAERLPDGADLPALLDALRALYAPRGVNLVEVAGKWAFRTASDLAFLLERERIEVKKLSKAAAEALAIVAYQPKPVTRTEIEEIRGVALSKGTLDVLIETGWIRPRGRRETPGRPMTYGVSEEFFVHFGLNDIADLPGVEELKAAGLFEPPPGEVPLLPGIEPETAAESSEAEDDPAAEELAQEREERAEAEELEETDNIDDDDDADDDFDDEDESDEDESEEDEEEDDESEDEEHGHKEG